MRFLLRSLSIALFLATEKRYVFSEQPKEYLSLWTISSAKGVGGDILGVGKVFQRAVDEKYQSVVIYLHYFIKSRLVAAEPFFVKLCADIRSGRSGADVFIFRHILFSFDH